MNPELQRISRDEINQMIDHRWMMENPDSDEHAFLFRLIQERHRAKFFQVVEHSGEDKVEVTANQLQEMDEERDRAEEILYWLYLDSELRKRGETLPDSWEKDDLGDFNSGSLPC